jgi:redox-sensitive bicupin YhaK (pirin superfamily)
VWVQVARGSLSVDGTVLDEGDGVSTEDAGELALEAREDAEAVVFDLG